MAEGFRKLRAGRTYSRHFDLETRQHELLGLDLGEGVPRRALVLGLLLFGVWDGLLLVLLGIPSRFTFTVFFLPPALVSFYGTQRSRRTDRRWNITNWALTARYHFFGHRPIVCGGRRSASRSEWLPRRERWGTKAEGLQRRLGPFGRLVVGGDEQRSPLAGPVVSMVARPYLYGPDQVYKAHRRLARSTKGQGSE